MESILLSIKKLLGVPEEDDVFDQDLIIYINSAFSVLNQLGIGPKDGFTITGKDETWSQFENCKKLQMLKSYVHLKVRLAFDPPISSIVVECFKDQLKEYEFRLIAANVENND